MRPCSSSTGVSPGQTADSAYPRQQKLIENTEIKEQGEWKMQLMEN